MRNELKILLIVSLLTAAFLVPAKAEVDITVITNGDVDIELDTFGDGTLLSIDYNGRDLLEELADKVEALHSIKVGMIFLANQQNMDRLEDELNALEEDIQKLVDELNAAFGDVYLKLGIQAHIIGVNPGNNTVAVTLISGNKTVADFLQESRDEIEFIVFRLDAIDARISALEDEIDIMLIEQGYAKESIDDNNEMIEKIQERIADRQEYIDKQLVDLNGKLVMNYIFIAGTFFVIIVLAYAQGKSYRKLTDRIKVLEERCPAIIPPKDSSEEHEEEHPEQEVNLEEPETEED